MDCVRFQLGLYFPYIEKLCQAPVQVSAQLSSCCLPFFAVYSFKPSFLVAFPPPFVQPSSLFTPTTGTAVFPLQNNELYGALYVHLCMGLSRAQVQPPPTLGGGQHLSVTMAGLRQARPWFLRPSRLCAATGGVRTVFDRSQPQHHPLHLRCGGGVVFSSSNFIQFSNTTNNTTLLSFILIMVSNSFFSKITCFVNQLFFPVKNRGVYTAHRTGRPTQTSFILYSCLISRPIGPITTPIDWQKL